MAQPLMSSITWEQSAAQLITPTTSALATINAIQAAVTASTSWTVASTGTVTATGAKYVEIKPSNTSSIYADQRIVFYEKVVSTTNKQSGTYTGGSMVWNSTSYVYFHFNPVGGSGTFNPNAAEGAVGQYIYSGGATGGYRYQQSFNNFSDVWGQIPLPATAIWTILGEGAFWMVLRTAATSHTLLGIGAIEGYIPNTGGVPDQTNASGTPWMLQSIYYKTGITSATFNVASFAAPTALGAFTHHTGTNSFWKATNNNIPTFVTIPTTFSQTNTFVPIPLMRGIYTTSGFKTRSVLQDSGTTIGYTWYPDDAQSGSALHCLAFLHT